MIQSDSCRIHTLEQQNSALLKRNAFLEEQIKSKDKAILIIRNESIARNKEKQDLASGKVFQEMERKNQKLQEKSVKERNRYEQKLRKAEADKQKTVLLSEERVIRIQNACNEKTRQLEEENQNLRNTIESQREAVLEKTKNIALLYNSIGLLLCLVQDKDQKIESLAAENKDLRDQIIGIKAAANRNSANSSYPTSMDRPGQTGKKVIPNSRVSTGKKPGGQPGHEGHRRQSHEFTIVPQPQEMRDVDEAVKTAAAVAAYAAHNDSQKTDENKTEAVSGAETLWIPEVEIPEEFFDEGRYRQLDKCVIHKKTFLVVTPLTLGMKSPCFVERSTGKIKRPPFPEGWKLEENYDTSVKAFSFFLHTHCNVSVRKSAELIASLTEGKINVAPSTILNWEKEFAEKSSLEQQEILKRLNDTAVMNIDFTNSPVNGQYAQTLICGIPGSNIVLFMPRQHKGHEGIKGSPAENYFGTLIHDHDKTFYSYGSNHQECIAHILRYLKGVADNEKRSWAGELRKVLSECLDKFNELKEGQEMDPVLIKEFEDKVRELLKGAMDDYDKNPPSRYYPEGKRLAARLTEYFNNIFLFLHEKGIVPNNSDAERRARTIKRKCRSEISIRSGIQYECITLDMSVIEYLRGMEGTLFRNFQAIFDRPADPSARAAIPDFKPDPPKKKSDSTCSSDNTSVKESESIKTPEAAGA